MVKKFTQDQINYIKNIARDLVDDGENKEYTRGITELIAYIDGKQNVDHADRADEIAIELGVV